MLVGRRVVVDETLSDDGRGGVIDNEMDPDFGLLSAYRTYCTLRIQYTTRLLKEESNLVTERRDTTGHSLRLTSDGIAAYAPTPRLLSRSRVYDGTRAADVTFQLGGRPRGPNTSAKYNVKAGAHSPGLTYGRRFSSQRVIFTCCRTFSDTNGRRG